MAVPPTITNDIAVPTAKLEDVHISESELPLSPPPTEDVHAKLTAILLPQLSEKASINLPSDAAYKENTARWSDTTFTSPTAVVNVASEADICAVPRRQHLLSQVKFATSHNLPFLAQSGTHGLSSSLQKLNGKPHLIINLRLLNNVTVDLPSGIATISAGTLTKEAVDAAHAAKAHIVAGVCNTVGLIPALLGGGMGNLISLYGLGVDQILCARLVLASGEAITCSPTQNSDLFWGIRGAGHNFGIVSELKVKAYEQVNGGVHWTGMLGFPGSKEILEKVTGAIKGMEIGEGMGVTMIWARPPPAFEPMILLNLWFAGEEPDARTAYNPFFALNPVMQICAPTPYNRVNDANDHICAKGLRKPAYSLGINSSHLNDLGKVWEQWVEWSGREGAGQSVVLTECYGFEKARQVEESSTAFAWRGVGAFVLTIPIYEKAELDAAAHVYGTKFRSTLQGEGPKRVYSNFANGDEEPAALYGGEERMERLRALKRRWDPRGVFGWYNPIC
ncbi:FAD-binding domain-containing protein [Stipitochalara longipes BDJ]|nr:FAD-binding domain-containing protein [Stipitochalara longipes BDJ]